MAPSGTFTIRAIFLTVITLVEATLYRERCVVSMLENQVFEYIQHTFMKDS